MMKLQVKAPPFPSLTIVNVVAFVVVALIVCAPIASGWRAFKIIFTSFPYQQNPELVDIKIKIVNNTDEPYMTMVQQFHEDLNSVLLNFAIALEINEGNYTTLVNRTLDYCKFLKKHSLDPVLRTIYDDLLKRSNFCKQCPIKKGIYTLHEYRVDEEQLPNYLPEANFLVYMKFTKSSGQLILEGTLHGKIDKSKGFNNLKMFSLG